MRQWAPQICGMLVWGWVLCSAAVVRAQEESQPETRSITISVDLATDTGTPMVDVPIAIIGSDAEAVFGRTDQAGHANVVVEVVPGEEWVFALFAPRSFEYPTTIVLDRQKFAEVTAEHHVSGCYEIAIDEQDVIFDLPIVAYPAVSVTGRLINSAGDPVWSAVVRRDTNMPVLTDKSSGAFSIGGLRKGVAGEILVGTEMDHWMSVPLSGAQTLADIDLGDITVPTFVHDATIQIDVANVGGNRRGRMQLEILTLVRSDGADIMDIELNRSGRSAAGFAGTEQHELPDIPAGVYYIAPGSLIGPNWTAEMLIDLIRAGRLAELDAAGVPKIEAVVGQVTELQMDAVQAENAIFVVGGG